MIRAAQSLRSATTPPGQHSMCSDSAERGPSESRLATCDEDLPDVPRIKPNEPDLRSFVLCVDVYVWLYVHVTGVQKGNRLDEKRT